MIKNSYCSYLKNRINYLNKLVNQNRFGRYILLEEKIHPLSGGTLFEITGVNGEGYNQFEDLNGSNTITPIACVTNSRYKHRYYVLDNTKRLLILSKFNCSLRKKKAENLAYERALKIAQLVERRTALSIIERTKRYSGVRESKIVKLC
ncbi:MAG: hypothetical protein WC867_06555 [Candidatus Pacearchaeota archaeon]|jgi:hypothetical protein